MQSPNVLRDLQLWRRRLEQRSVSRCRVTQEDAQRGASVIARFILTGAEKDGDAQREAEQFGDILFTDDRLSGYRSIVHKTYFVLEYVVCARDLDHPNWSDWFCPVPVHCRWLTPTNFQPPVVRSECSAIEAGCTQMLGSPDENQMLSAVDVDTSNFLTTHRCGGTTSGSC